MDHRSAQCVLGRVLLAESKTDTSLDSKQFTEELLPSMDPFGRPTGGSKNATETKLEILRIRHKVRSGQEEKPKVQEGLE